MKKPAWDMLESRNDIRKTAFLLFRKLGYKATSYSMIAEESGQGRPLVQYYYPKKEEIAIEFIEEALKTIIQTVQFDSALSDTPELQTLHTGQLYYSFLLWDEDMRRFTKEVLENRAISSHLVEVNADRSLPHLVTEQDVEPVRAISIKATGGVYELLYLQLQKGDLYKPGEYALQNTATFLSQTTDTSYEDTCERLRSELLPDEVERDLTKEIFTKLF